MKSLLPESEKSPIEKGGVWCSGGFGCTGGYFVMPDGSNVGRIVISDELRGRLLKYQGVSRPNMPTTRRDGAKK